MQHRNFWVLGDDARGRGDAHDGCVRGCDYVRDHRALHAFHVPHDCNESDHGLCDRDDPYGDDLYGCGYENRAA